MAGGLIDDFKSVFTKTRDRTPAVGAGGISAGSNVGTHTSAISSVRDLMQRSPDVHDRFPQQAEGMSKMSTPNPVVTAAVPALIAALEAIQTFVTNLGTDPLQVAVKFPGALQVLIGTIELQVPGLATAELGALQAEVNAKIAGAIAKLKAQAP